MTTQRKLRPKGEPASKQKLRLWIRLLGASRAVEVELRRRLRAEFAETLPRFDVMAALYRCPAGMTMTELSRYLMVSNGNVTGIIERLASEGRIERLADKDDRRTTYVRLTPAGVDRFGALAKAHEAWVGELLAGVESREADALIELLAPIRQPSPATARVRGGKPA